jgi:hypothetical protein
MRMAGKGSGRYPPGFAFDNAALLADRALLSSFMRPTPMNSNANYPLATEAIWSFEFGRVGKRHFIARKQDRT